MASMETDKIERLRDRMLQCPICMDEYKDPRILPCHHTVCLNCLLDYVHASSSSGRLFRCPQCRADVCVPRGGVKDFPPNFYINCIQDELGSRPYFGICEVCERDWLVSQYRCIDCDVDICKFCVHDHRLFTHMTGRQPNIIRIETGNIGEHLTSERYCERHKDEALQMFCMTCDKVICVSCMCDGHKRHETMTLGKQLQLAQKHLQFDLDQLQIDMKEVKTSLARLTDLEKTGEKSADDAIQQIREHTAAITSRLQKIADLSVEKVQATKGKYVKEIRDYETELTGYVDQLSRGATFLGELQQEDMCLELLTCFQKFRGLLDATQRSVANKLIKQNSFSFTPGKMINKFGHMYVGRGRLTNKVSETLFMERKRKKLLGRWLFWRPSLFGFVAMLVCLCVMVGGIQLGTWLASEGASVESVACALFYGYICIAAMFAYRKSYNNVNSVDLDKPIPVRNVSSGSTIF